MNIINRLIRACFPSPYSVFPTLASKGSMMSFSPTTPKNNEQNNNIQMSTYYGGVKEDV